MSNLASLLHKSHTVGISRASSQHRLISEVSHIAEHRQSHDGHRLHLSRATKGTISLMVKSDGSLAGPSSWLEEAEAYVVRTTGPERGKTGSAPASHLELSLHLA